MHFSSKPIQLLTFLGFLLQGSLGLASVSIQAIESNEDINSYISRIHTHNADRQLFRQILGAASDFKEGDHSLGLGADSELSRSRARQLLSQTKISDLIEANRDNSDSIQNIIDKSLQPELAMSISSWKIGELKAFLLNASEPQIKKIMPGLHSDAIAAVVKLMSNQDLVQIGKKIFNALPNSSIGKKGYFSARLQPNSSTDHPEDIRWQVFNGWAFGVGDLMLGTNPASSTPEIIHRTELVLREIIETFGLQEVLPWVVLSHIDIQNQVEARDPKSTALWFQSIAGNDAGNDVFGISATKMMDYAKSRKGQRYGLYMETGQGSEVTNGQSQGLDMGTLESRKYGLSRALKTEQGGQDSWMVVNDVAGFIGPEVFRTKEQLVRVALEDTIMGKLHGITMGLDVCSTFHMPITPEDLRWANDKIAEANPAYLIALPTQNDPMLSYNTTPFQEHLRLREKFNYKIDDRMMKFFIQLGIFDQSGKPTQHFGDPLWLNYQFRKAKGDTRSFEQISIDARKEMEAVQRRGVALSIGHGKKIWDFNLALKADLDRLDAAARKSIHSPLSPEFQKSALPRAHRLTTQAATREQYLLQPPAGEVLSLTSAQELKKIDIGNSDVVIVIGDGLNSDAIMDRGHLRPFLAELKTQLKTNGWNVYQKPLLVENARVRVGYRIGDQLFSKSENPDQIKIIIHVIGERPGNGHNTFSAYIATETVKDWKTGKHDHDRTDLISGISDTSLKPRQAAVDVIEKIRLRAHALAPHLSCQAVFSGKNGSFNE